MLTEKQYNLKGWKNCFRTLTNQNHTDNKHQKQEKFTTPTAEVFLQEPTLLDLKRALHQEQI